MKQPYELFKEVELETGITREKLIHQCKREPFMSARLLFIRKARDEGYRPVGIARHLKRDRTTIEHHLERMA